jgi:hypothetical protein
VIEYLYGEGKILSKKKGLENERKRQNNRRHKYTREKDETDEIVCPG